MTHTTLGRAYVRDPKGVYHGARWFNGRFFLTCCEGDESELLRVVPDIPETVLEEQLCERNWPRRSSDAPERYS